MLSWVLVFARFFALGGFLVLVLQVILTSRLPLFKALAPYDRLTKFHRTGGIIAAVLIAVHVLLIVVSKIITGSLTIALFTWFGIGSALLLAAAVITAMWYRRLPMRYEGWRGIHFAVYGVFSLAFVHGIFNGTYLNSFQALRNVWFVLLGVFAAVLLWRLIRVIRMASRPVRVGGTVSENHDTTTVRFEGKPFRHRAGQFMFVRFPGRGNLKGTHPFTISAHPSSEDLTITVKAVGDFTAALPEIESGDKAWIEGPYGGFTLPVYGGAKPGTRENGRPLVMIAGGIGITPFLSMLRELAASGTAASVLLVWGNKTERDILRREEIESFQAKIGGFRAVHVMSDDPGWPGEKGYVDIKFLERYVSDWDRSQFYICGPPVMMGKLVSAFSERGIRMKRIKWERFAL